MEEDRKSEQLDVHVAVLVPQVVGAVGVSPLVVAELDLELAHSTGQYLRFGTCRLFSINGCSRG